MLNSCWIKKYTSKEWKWVKKLRLSRLLIRTSSLPCNILYLIRTSSLPCNVFYLIRTSSLPCNIFYKEGKWTLAYNSYILIMFAAPDVIELWYIKLWILRDHKVKVYYQRVTVSGCNDIVCLIYIVFNLWRSSRPVIPSYWLRSRSSRFTIFTSNVSRRHSL